MRKYLIMAVISIMVFGSLIGLNINNAKAQVDEGQRFSIDLYLYSEGQDNDFLSTEVPSMDVENQTKNCPLVAQAPVVSGNVGTWRSMEIQKDIAIYGETEFVVWASGNVNYASFTVSIDDPHDDVDNENTHRITTERKDLGSSPQTFKGTGNIDREDETIIFYAGDIIEMQLTWDAPLTGVNDEARIHYGGRESNDTNARLMDSHLSITCNAVYIDPEEDINMDFDNQKASITYEFIDAFGKDDLLNNSYYMQINGEQGFQKILSAPTITSEDNSNITSVTWVWGFGEDQSYSGDYSITVNVTDRSGNIWSLSTEKFYMTLLGESKVDIQIEGIFFSRDPIVNEEVLINATIKLFGDENVNNLRVEIEYFADDASIGSETIHISTGESEISSMKWIPTEEKSYNIKVVIDPNNNVKETKEDNNEQLTTAVAKEPGYVPQNEEDEWYEEFWDWTKDDAYYSPIIIPIVVVIAVASGIGIKRRRRSKEEFKETEEESEPPNKS